MAAGIPVLGAGAIAMFAAGAGCTSGQSNLRTPDGGNPLGVSEAGGVGAPDGGSNGAPAEAGCPAAPASPSWTAMSNANAPMGTSDFSVSAAMQAWTGRTLIIVYHGAAATNQAGALTGDLHGASFDPAANTWSTFDVSSVPADAQSMRWMGTTLLIWGASSGAAYDPATGAWTARALPNAPRASAGPWSGSKLLQLGTSPTDSYDHYDTMKVYDFEKGVWTAVQGAGAPSARYFAARVVAGDRFVVWGGYFAMTSPTNPSAYVHPMAQDGAILDINAGTWTSVATSGAPAPRHSPQVAVWLSGRFVLWGGQSIDLATDKTTYLADGAVLDPVADSWSPMDASGAPNPMSTVDAVVSTDRKIVVFGGQSASANPNVLVADGSTYDVALNTWTPLAGAAAPTAAQPPSLSPWGWPPPLAVGSRVAFMGPGLDYVRIFDPAANAWQFVPVPAMLAGRSNYLVSWTGCRLVVFGGQLIMQLPNPCGATPPNTGCDPPGPNITPLYDGAMLAF